MIAAFVGLFSVAACSGEGAVETALDEGAYVLDGTAVVVEEEEAVEPTATRATRSVGPEAGDVLMIEIASCGVFDPAVDVSDNVGSDGLRVVHEIHAGLVSVTGERPPTVELELASSYAASDDGMRYEFELRPGLKFSDGSRLQASDVVYSWERALRKSTAESEARRVFGRVVGLERFLARPGEGLAGLTAIDDRRLVVELATPDPEFLLRIARPVAYVVSASDAPAWDSVFVNEGDEPGAGLTNTLIPVTALPVGAGPFVLVEYADPRLSFGYGGMDVPAHDRCVLVRNDHYWRTDRPRLDAVVAYAPPTYWQSIDWTMERQVEQFEAGELDVLWTIGQYELAEHGSTAARVVRNVSTDLQIEFMVFNPEVAPMDYVESRRALAAAVPTYFAWGYSRQLNLIPEVLLPSEVKLPRPDWRYSTYTDPSTDFGLTGAKVDYYTYFEGAGLNRDDVFDAWSRELGVDVSIKLDDWQGSRREPPLIERQLVTVRVSTTSAVASTVLHAALGAFGAGDAPGEFGSLMADLAAAEMEPDLVKRMKKYVAVEKELLDRAYVLPMVSEVSEDRFALQPWVEGFEISPFGGSVFADVWLTSEAPEREYPAIVR